MADLWQKVALEHAQSNPNGAGVPVQNLSGWRRLPRPIQSSASAMGLLKTRVVEIVAIAARCHHVSRFPYGQTRTQVLQPEYTFPQ